MARLYSARLIAVHAGASGSFTVSPGYTAVVRQVLAFNGSALAPETAALVLQPTNATIYQELLDPNGFNALELRCVFYPGEHIDTNNGSDIDMVVSGYLLATP